MNDTSPTRLPSAVSLVWLGIKVIGLIVVTRFLFGLIFLVLTITLVALAT